MVWDLRCGRAIRPSRDAPVACLWRFVTGMGPLARTRACLEASLLLGLLLAVPSSARASEIAAQGAPTTSGIVIHDAAETLRDWCRTDEQGLLWLELPGGARYELVTSVDDPAIANQGDGSFHAFDAAEVAAALAAVSYPLGDVAADVFLLPFPRRAGLSSAAGTGLILLSPGVYPLPRTQQHAEVVHELGHVVQRADLPDSDTAAWTRYRALRGILDASVYNADAAHADRPHEIFAEDFRALFGGALATSSGTIENATLTPPDQVPGLEGFLRSLAGPPLAAVLGAVPNPGRGAVVFSLGATAPAVGSRAPLALDLFDVTGRRLATLRSTAAGDGQLWSWDGRDERGRRVEPGVVFARTRDGGASARVVLLP